MVLRSVWFYRAVFLILALAVLFFALLPFSPGEGRIPGPDLTLALLAAWVLRRPDYVPVWLVVGVLLLDDVLMMRPLGLWALIGVLLSEYLRRRVDYGESQAFWPEVGMVSICIAVAFVLDYIALVLLLAERPPVLGQALHGLATIVFYPPVAILSQMIGVRRLAPGELDSLGARA